MNDLASALEPVPATVDRLAEENRTLREELAATHRQLTQIAWGLVSALVGAATAVIVALV